MTVVALVTGAQLTYEPATFADFWLLYPKREAKKDALKAWSRLTAAQQIAALVGLVVWRRIWIERDEMQYVPFPATWLRGERWEDEPPADSLKTAHASHLPAQLGETERGEMPAHVRELLAKMRKK